MSTGITNPPFAKPARRAEPLLQRIAAEFPKLQWQDYRYIDEGWDHEVIILDERIVFRFPTNAEYTEQLSDEIAVLDYLAPKVAVGVPRYSYVAAAKDFAGYSIVPGRQLSRELFDSLSPDQYAALTRQLAGFLSTLHNLDTHAPELSAVSPAYLPADQLEVTKMSEKHLQPLLSADDYRIVQRILADVDALLLRSLPTVFIHNDVYNRHLLWDKGAAKLGVIDFSDMCFSDPALDFAELHEYGTQFVEDICAQYTGPKDDSFLERSWKYQRWVGVYMMTDYFEVQKTSFEVARETFDRVK